MTYLLSMPGTEGWIMIIVVLIAVTFFAYRILDKIRKNNLGEE